MKRFTELILLLPLLLFLAYALFLYISTGGEKWNPIILPASAITHTGNTASDSITPAAPQVAASIFNLPALQATATHTPQPTATTIRIPSPTRSPLPLPTFTPIPTFTPTAVFTPTPNAGTSVPVGLRVHCPSVSDPRYDWLVLLSACEMVTGDVTMAYLDSPPEGDGDYVLNVLLDAGQEAFLSAGNKRLGDTLQAKITQDEQRRMIDLPEAGMHIALIGTWVQNTHRYDWFEFNPVRYWAELP